MALRDGNIDFAKGCAIVLMVVGHVWGGAPDAFVNLFHMSFFLMASGLFFDCRRVGSSSGLISFGVARLRRLYFPYVFWTVVFLSLNNLFLDMHFLADEARSAASDGGKLLALSSYMTWQELLVRLPRVLVMKDWTFHTGPCWFLITLLYVSVGYGVASYLLSRATKHLLLIQTILAVVFVVFAQFVPGHSLFGVQIGVGGRNFAAYALFHAGVLLRKVNLSVFFGRGLKPTLIFCASLAVLLSLQCLGCRICLSRNEFDGGVVLILAAASGFATLYSASILIEGYLGRLADVIRYVGRRTMPILIFHWTAISIVNRVICMAFDLSPDLTAARPADLVGNILCVGYLLCGIGIPLLFGEIYLCVMRMWRSKTSSK